MRLDLSGSRALIMGGSCELGMALGEMLISQGVTPVLTYRSDAGRRRIDEGLEASRGAFEGLELDLGADDPCGNLTKCLNKGVDYLIDFAHETLEALMASVDPGAARAYLEANIGARYEVVHRVARKMLASRSGRMVYVSSTAARCPNAGQGFYAAAKQASEALYRNVGLELAQRGITTVTLRPGYVEAGRGRRYAKKNQPSVRKMIPLGRLLRVEEVAATIVFLLCDSAAGINATAVTMDGGLSAGK